MSSLGNSKLSLGKSYFRNIFFGSNGQKIFQNNFFVPNLKFETSSKESHLGSNFDCSEKKMRIITK